MKFQETPKLNSLLCWLQLNNGSAFKSQCCPPFLPLCDRLLLSYNELFIALMKEYFDENQYNTTVNKKDFRSQEPEFNSDL
ncbi:hypothetical protein [Nostoc sp. JL23]|uniref:hypothetical protein n=1 Tax=Nostoc sp. JL23 TaxID=2815394 RepID=UPI001DB438CB|nr:hypothetical protein [Nostoc sp. JL23]MBN3878078.1 hypothetical protein [Nostoc sp. JL23]